MAARAQLSFAMGIPPWSPSPLVPLIPCLSSLSFTQVAFTLEAPFSDLKKDEDPWGALWPEKPLPAPLSAPTPKLPARHTHFYPKPLRLGHAPQVFGDDLGVAPLRGAKTEKGEGSLALESSVKLLQGPGHPPVSLTEFFLEPGGVASHYLLPLVFSLQPERVTEGSGAANVRTPETLTFASNDDLKVLTFFLFHSFPPLIDLPL
jgi:hypothetical protein